MTAKPIGRGSRAPVVISFILVVAALRLGREVLMPFALAVLISFLLAPLVIWLERRIGRIFAVISVTLVSFIFMVAVGLFMFQQVTELAEKLPEQKQNITNKVRGLRDSVSQKLGKASQTVTEITKELKPHPAAGGLAGPVTSEVVVVKPVASTVSSTTANLLGWIGTFVNPLAAAAVVIVFVIFILIYYDDLRDRILRLMGTGHLNVTTQAIDDAANRVSRYLLMQSLINVCHGTAVAAGLFLLGVPSPLFFGLSSALLRYIPYLGPVLAAAMPILLSLAVFEGWATPIYTACMFILIELLSNNVLEPWLYGSSTGLSPMAVILAAVFWSWLWGPIGLVLSAPLTVCLVVLGKHVAQLHFLNIMLTDQPVLEPKDRLYQRMLVMDQEGALDIAEEYLQDHTLAEVFEDVLVPALSMSERDRHQGDQEDLQERFILEHMREVIDEIRDASRQIELKKGAIKGAEGDRIASEPSSVPTVNILCLPARDEADELVGLMLAQLLEQDGHQARTVSASALAGEIMELVEKGDAQIACISALPPMEVAHARYLYKRLRARFDDLHILVGLWTSNRDPLKSLKRTREDEFLKGATSLTAAREIIGQLAQTLALKKNGDEHERWRVEQIPCGSKA